MREFKIYPSNLRRHKKDTNNRTKKEYANNWLVSQIAVRAETVNVTAHRVGCNTLIVILLGL